MSSTEEPHVGQRIDKYPGRNPYSVVVYLENWRVVYSWQWAVFSRQGARGKGLGARGLSGDRICWAVYSRQSAVFSRQSSVGSFQSAVGNRQGASLSAAEIPPNARHSQRESKGAVRRQNLLGSLQSAVGSLQLAVGNRQGASLSAAKIPPNARHLRRESKGQGDCQETVFTAFQYPIASKKGKVKRKFCQETVFPAYQYPIASKKGKVKRII